MSVNGHGKNGVNGVHGTGSSGIRGLPITGRKIRLAAVSFLNTRPITYGLERGLGAERFELRFDLPSRCAAALAAGEVDLALIPSAVYPEIPDLRVAPGVAIASRGPVGTVLLCGQVPWEQMRSVALDGASRTSAMLTKLLSLHRGLNLSFAEVDHQHTLDSVHGTRGALIIGDTGFEAAHRFPHVYDLGEAWFQLTGLPFVFAFWAGPQGVLTPDDAALLRASLDAGLERRDEIARSWAAEQGGDPGLYRTYLTEQIRYQLGAEELSGAAAFYERAQKLGLLRERVPLRLFHDQQQPERAARLAREVAPAFTKGLKKADDPGSPLEASPGTSIRSVDSLLADAAAGKRLSPEEGARLYDQAPVLELGAAADLRRQALHGDGIVTYIIDRNVNYTNVCVTRCKFCNFYRPPGHADGYVLSKETLAQKLQETVELGGVQILLQGGLNPDLPLAYYEDLFRWMKANFPLAIHGLSPEEIRYIAEKESISIRAVLERLVAAGLDSVPGGGAEILDDEVRAYISPLKCSTETWLEVMRQAHILGLRTTATMVFGFGETTQHLVNHLERLRALQDESAGFTAFICWPFQAEGTRLKLRDDTSAMRYLRTFAFSRLYLDNFPSLQVSWPTMGPEVGQVGLRFGGNDFGSAMIEENVVSQAGAIFALSAEDIERYVRAAGFEPRRRNMRYELLPVAA